MTDKGIKPVAIHIMEHRNLLSRPNLLGGFSNFNSSINISKSNLRLSGDILILSGGIQYDYSVHLVQRVKNFKPRFICSTFWFTGIWYHLISLSFRNFKSWKIYFCSYLAFLSAFYLEKLKQKFFRQRSFRVVRGLFEQSEVSLRLPCILRYPCVLMGEILKHYMLGFKISTGYLLDHRSMIAYHW